VPYGRRKECAVIDRLLGAAVIGQSEALVARGEVVSDSVTADDWDRRVNERNQAAGRIRR
jgi:hypothetical protein